MMRARIRVLAIDDSSVAREAYRALFAAARGFDLVGAAPDAELGRRALMRTEPDVVVLDLQMPGVDGLTFLKWMMRARPTPVVVATSLDRDGARRAIDALALGALALVTKTSGAGGCFGPDFRAELLEAIRTAAGASRVLLRETAARPAAERPLQPVALPACANDGGLAILMGASTGGTEVIAWLLRQLPPGAPAVVIAQHMPAGFTRSFAERLDALCSAEVREAKGGERLAPGTVFVAPGGFDLALAPSGRAPSLQVAPPRGLHRPSVDVLFESGARALGARAIGVLLTGMGSDGACGLLAIRQAGGLTVAQDAATAVVYGMPREAVRVGAAQLSLPTDQILPRVLAHVARSSDAARAPKEPGVERQTSGRGEAGR